MAENCIFCRIIKGEIPCRKVFESENTLAFLDINPVGEGHTVVIPKKHFRNLTDFPESEMVSFLSDMKKTANKLMDKLSLDGFNVFQNNFPAAGQVVDHCHFHILPRKKDDKLFKFPPHLEYSDENFDALMKKLA